jgi:hypothetical protein
MPRPLILASFFFSTFSISPKSMPCAVRRRRRRRRRR